MTTQAPTCLEKSLWKAAGIEPKGSLVYRSRARHGRDAGHCQRAQRLHDNRPWNLFGARVSAISLPILIEGDKALLNIYSVMEVNPANGPRVNSAGGKAFADFMVAPQTQNVIRSFGVEKFGQSLFVPVAGKKEDEIGV